MNLDAIKSSLEEFDITALLPDLGELMGRMDLLMRILVLAAPVVMVVMGLIYLFASPKEANHHFGYRCYFGMGSVDAWRFTQRVAGLTWTLLGLILGIVMLVLSSNFAGQNVMDMVLSAVIYALCQAGLIVLATIFIRAIVAARFNRHGDYRGKK